VWTRDEVRQIPVEFPGVYTESREVTGPIWTIVRFERVQQCSSENLVQDIVQEFCVAGGLTFNPGEGGQFFFVFYKLCNKGCPRSRPHILTKESWQVLAIAPQQKRSHFQQTASITPGRNRKSLSGTKVSIA